MTEDIIAMARRAGAHDDGFEVRFVELRYLERFAALVRADEREACAALAEQTVCDTHLPTGVKIYGTRAAKVIRARGQA
jgi:hypothetical protein